MTECDWTQDSISNITDGDALRKHSFAVKSASLHSGRHWQSAFEYEITETAHSNQLFFASLVRQFPTPAGLLEIAMVICKFFLQGNCRFGSMFDGLKCRLNRRVSDRIY
jgi:hypothetical protein